MIRPSRWFARLLLCGMTVTAAALPALPQMPPSPVRFTEAEEHSVHRSIKLPGTAESPTSSLVATPVAGIVVALESREGTSVTQGRVLARLDTVNLELQLETLMAQLKEARARLKLAENNLSRARDLFDSEVVAQQQLDDASSEFTAWQGRVEALTARKSRIDMDLERSSIRAPFHGVVVSEETEIGEWLAIGDPVVELLSLDALDVRVEVPERFFQNLVPDGEASVSFKSLPDLAIRGKIIAIIPRADPQARTFPVKVRIPNREGRIGVGMLAQVELLAGESYRATVIPKDALLTHGTENFVFVLQGDDTVHRTAVEPGDGIGAWIVVRGDIQPGQRVITRGNERLEEGQSVAAQPMAYEGP